jgi:hypothetical protein
MHANHFTKHSSCLSFALTGPLYQSDWCSRSPSTWHSHQSDWWVTQVRPIATWELQEPKMARSHSEIL